MRSPRERESSYKWFYGELGRSIMGPREEEGFLCVVLGGEVVLQVMPGDCVLWVVQGDGGEAGYERYERGMKGPGERGASHELKGKGRGLVSGYIGEGGVV